ncbi:hypothetical protein Tco_1203469 [Tanacetum coccineum]
MSVESIESYYARFSKIMNDLKRHGCLLEVVASNTKFLNSLQPKWDKVAKTHDSLALVANHYVAPSSSHAQSPYYVAYLPFVPDVDIEAQSFEFQGEATHDDPADSLTMAMMLLTIAITQCYSTPRNNHLRASLNTHNQVYVHDGRVNVQSKNAEMQRVPRTSATSGNTQNVQCYNCNEKGHYDTDIANEVIQLYFWVVDSGCSKDMTRNLKLLRKFIEKFMGIVHFGNDHFDAITAYGDYVHENITI